MGLLSFLGKQEKTNLKEFVQRGAIIVDVRTPGEFNTGQIIGSENIPLDTLHAHLNEIKRLNVPVITCCASGMRSGVAANQLKSVGIEAVNGGSWYNVKLETDKECK